MSKLTSLQLDMMMALAAINAIIILFILITNYISKEKKKALLIMTVSAMFLLVFDRFAYIYRGNTNIIGFIMVRLSNYMVFASSLSILYGFIEYIRCILINVKSKLLTFTLSFLKHLNCVGQILLLVSQFINLYYSIDANNIYHRESGFVICYIIPFSSMIVLLIITILNKKNISESLFGPLLIFNLLPLSATILQLYMYGFSLTNMTCALAVILLYVSIINDANIMVKDTERIENELKIASEIQLNECPVVFPNRKEFDLFATTLPAKEVGGDFYDYFMLDDNHLGMVIADVSGKGVPAALNMVKAKLLVKGTGLYMSNPGKVLSLVNDAFIDGNKLDMFVTIWFGILDTTSGKLTFANAGHDDAIVYTKEKGFNLLKTKHGVPIGAMPKYEYKNESIKLEKGDKVFIYTDGILDQINKRNQKYGIDRLVLLLNKNKDSNVEELINIVKKDVESFSEKCDQYDDITMLGLELNDKDKVADTIHLRQKFKADVKEIDNVYNSIMERTGNLFGLERLNRYFVVIDEIFSNIAKYAYKDITDGREEYVILDFKLDYKNAKVVLTFEDNGVPFNPITIMDPKLSKSAKKREIGGLGIYIVKQMMDKVSYEYKNGKNYLTIEKNFTSNFR